MNLERDEPGQPPEEAPSERVADEGLGGSEEDAADTPGVPGADDQATGNPGNAGDEDG